MPLDIGKYTTNKNAAPAGGGYVPSIQGIPSSSGGACGRPGAMGYIESVATALLASSQLTATAYQTLQALGPDETLRQGYISRAEYAILTGKDAPAHLTATTGFQTFVSGWFNSPAIAAGTASGTTAVANSNVTALNSYSFNVPAGFQLFKVRLEHAIRVIPSTGTFGLTLTNTNGGIVEFLPDFDNTTVGAEDDNGKRSINVAGQVRRVNINAAAEAIAADTFAYRYVLELSRID